MIVIMAMSGDRGSRVYRLEFRLQVVQATTTTTRVMAVGKCGRGIVVDMRMILTHVCIMDRMVMRVMLIMMMAAAAEIIELAWNFNGSFR